MTVGGAFLGGGSIKVPAGKCQFIYQIMTEDRANLSGATITATDNAGHTYAETTGSDGYATELVDASGQIYTVSISVTGYDNISAQEIVAESGTTKYVRFELDIPKIQKSKIVTSFGTSPSNENVPSEKLVFDSLKAVEIPVTFHTIPGVTLTVGYVYRIGNLLDIWIQGSTTGPVNALLVSDYPPILHSTTIINQYQGMSRGTQLEQRANGFNLFATEACSFRFTGIAGVIR